jgi:hypothetical protein
MRNLLVSAALALLAAASPAAARPAASPGTTYDALAKRARAGDRGVDVARLRQAAGEAGVTSPRSDRDRLTSAARTGDARLLARAADAVLARNYVDLLAHHLAAKAAAALGDARGEDHHRWLLMELVNAVTASGDGQTPATPMVVISEDEVSFMLQVLHVELEEQGRGTCNGHPCEALQVKHRDGKQATWYFDVHLAAARSGK